MKTQYVTMIKMGKEQTPGHQPETDPHQVVLEIFNQRVDQLKEAGEIRRVTDITNDEELDDHFDDLWRVYRQVCLELGLDWPFPFSDDAVDSRLPSADDTP